MHKTIYLHIGSGKTGTTSIQHMLNENQKALLDHGYLYHPSNPNKARPNHHNLVSSPFNNKTWDKDKLEYQKLKDIFLQSSASVMIISTERMMGVPIYYIQNIKKLFADIDIKIVAYVRNQIDSMPSYFLQRQKDYETDYNGDIENFFHHYKHNLGNEIQKILDNWLPIFGKENMIIRVYDRDMLINKDICQDFAQTLNIEPMVNNSVYSSNESLLPELSSLVTTIDTLLPALKTLKYNYRQMVIIKNLLKISTLYKAGDQDYDANFDILANDIHHHFKKIKTKKLYRIFIAIENTRLLMKQGEKVYLLSPALKKEILDYYKINNNRFSETFLNTEEANYFLKKYNN